MKIAGLARQSFVDYPGKIAACVFTQGCNMNCGFCHNRSLVGSNHKNPLIDEAEVISFLHRRRKFLDGVVITGGEPTLQPDLDSFIKRVKNMGYPVKLDTNGTKPDVLKKLIEKNLLDYIAMDIKAPMKKYRDICRSDFNEEALLECISIIKNSNVDYEFRTTCCPQLNESDIYEIADLIKGAKKYVLQQYRETDPLEGGYTGKAKSMQFMDILIKKLGSCVSAFQFRGEYSVKAT
ncbi:MAG: anaerobic ribonucleoside-triphosphate reductase activating protein [Clostridiaceae bacterium]|nr:anaerobic ribonucleoside-triphosphate reductase activating protein [Clostridiaceae bacterium]